MKNWKWQDDLVARADDEAIAVIAPCGTGKTRGAIKLSEAKGLDVIIICPPNLRTQWQDEIVNVHGEGEREVFIVDSGKRKTKKYQERFKEFLE